MHVGLLRKYQGKLLLAPCARNLGGDPVGLRRHRALNVRLAKSLLIKPLAGRGSSVRLPIGVDRAARFRTCQVIWAYWSLIMLSGSGAAREIVVVDDLVALIGSANLISRAMESNIECGILIRGGRQPRARRRAVRERSHATAAIILSCSFITFLIMTRRGGSVPRSCMHDSASTRRTTGDPVVRSACGNRREHSWSMAVFHPCG